MMEMSYVCTFQCGSHKPYTVIEHLKYASGAEKLGFYFYLILINQNFNGYAWLMATILDSTVSYKYSKLHQGHSKWYVYLRGRARQDYITEALTIQTAYVSR